MDEIKLPAAGDLIGWAVYYGDRYQHRMPILGDYEHAMQAAVKHGGILVEMYAGVTHYPAMPKKAAGV